MVVAIDSMMESFYCNSNIMVDSDFYLTQWSKWHVLGNENFIEIKLYLSAYVNDLLDYMSFINFTPMMENFIHYKFVEDEINICTMFFFISLDSFMKY